MNQVELIVVEGPNYGHISLGYFELELIPRIGEFIFYEREGDDGPQSYKVNSVIHNIQSKLPVEIWMVSLEDEKYH